MAERKGKRQQKAAATADQLVNAAREVFEAKGYQGTTVGAITEAANIREGERYSGWRLHPLKGDRHGTWGMVLTRNQRVTFVLRGSSVENVDVKDYH